MQKKKKKKKKEVDIFNLSPPPTTSDTLTEWEFALLKHILHTPIYTSRPICLHIQI